MPKLNAELKAELLATGTVDVDESLLVVLVGTSTSSAGPGTGQKSLFFKFGSHRVRLEINKNSQPKLGMVLEVVISVYNDAPHQGLDSLSPDEYGRRLMCVASG